jgi:UDP-glucose 4-epimerase
MEVEPDIIHLLPRYEVQEAYSLHDKMKDLFGNRTQHTLDEGLYKMAQWVKNHGSRTSKKFDNIEITKNFPKAWVE